jgi:hypothetical protein
MKKVGVIAFLIWTLSSSGAYARDAKLLLPIDQAMGTFSSQEKLSGDVKFYFGDQPHPKVLSDFGGQSTMRKTNSFGKSDDVACNWAFLTVMLVLEKRAHELGANAVINIVSDYNSQEYSSASQYECHAGGLMNGVALKGEFVKLADK